MIQGSLTQNIIINQKQFQTTILGFQHIYIKHDPRPSVFPKHDAWLLDPIYYYQSETIPNHDTRLPANIKHEPRPTASPKHDRGLFDTNIIISQKQFQTMIPGLQHLHIKHDPGPSVFYNHDSGLTVFLNHDPRPKKFQTMILGLYHP